MFWAGRLGKMNEWTDQKKSVADMMQDRCNGFSGQALHHLNASEACQPCYVTQPANRLAAACVSCSFHVGFRWAKEEDAIGGMGIVTIKDGSRDSKTETRLFHS
jgi:hypothetical protein